MIYNLIAVSAALDVHPRTILRIVTGQPNPYWVEGYDPAVDLDMVALSTGASVESFAPLFKNEDSALTVEEAAKMLSCTAAEFYRKGLIPDWQVGRVKRYSLRRLGKMVAP